MTSRFLRTLLATFAVAGLLTPLPLSVVGRGLTFPHFPHKPQRHRALKTTAPRVVSVRSSSRSRTEPTGRLAKRPSSARTRPLPPAHSPAGTASQPVFRPLRC